MRADEARQFTKEALDKKEKERIAKLSSEFKTVLLRIKETADIGSSDYTIMGYIEPETKTKLEELGYNVKTYSGLRTVKISW